MSDEESLNRIEAGEEMAYPEDKEEEEEGGGEPDRPKLNALNFLNVFFYLANVIATNLVGAIGIAGLPTNGETSLKYQTLVTPIGWTFSIWAVIYVFQAIWTFLQLFPNYRAHPYVQNGVAYWYILVCITQIGWTFTFAYEVIWLSLLMISLILVTLTGCVVGAYYQYPYAKKTFIEFWFLLFPFSIHFGWVACATLVNANVVVVWAKASAVTQITVAICSLALLHAVGVFSLFVPDRPNYTVPGVISWATLGIYFALDKPLGAITATFDNTTISSIKYSAGVVCLLMLLFIVLRLSVAVYRKCSGKVEELQSTEAETEPVLAPSVSFRRAL